MSFFASNNEKTADILVRYRNALAISVILTIALFSCFLFRIRFENSIESFISPKDPDLKYYTEFKKEFGDDQMIIVAIPVGDVFTKEALLKIDAVSKEMKQIQGVRKVRSITATQDIVGSEGGFEVKPFIEKIPDDPEALARLKKTALANPLYQRDLVSLDGTIASILIEPKNSDADDRYKKIFDAVIDIMRRSPFKNDPYYLAGEPLVELQLTQDMWKDLGLFLPATYLCLALLLFVLFRDWPSVLIQVVVISLCLGFLGGLMGAMHMTMNAVTVGLPSLLLCIAVLDSIHILTIYRYHLSHGKTYLEAMRSTLLESLEPCFLTSVTTVIGFASMAVSELVPIRQFGILGALGTAAAFPICVLTMPALMRFIPVKFVVENTQKSTKTLGAFFKGVQKWQDNKLFMVAALVLIIGASFWGMSRIKVETNNIHFLRKSSPVRVATDYIENKLGGTSMLEITVRVPEDDMIKDPRVLQQIEKFQDYLKTLSPVDKSASPVQFIKQMHQVMNDGNPDFYFVPDSRNLIAQYILSYSFSGRDNDLDDFVDYTYRTARVRGRMKQQNSRALKETLRQIHVFADKNFDKDLQVRITSHALLQANMIDTLVSGQVNGFGIEFVSLLIIFALAHRSLTVGFFSLIPNAIPLLACLGLMGLAGITLNIGTAMTVCIAFGLVVDDTVHLLHHARECFRKERDVSKVFDKIFEIIGPPVLFTSLLLAGGFAILLFGHSYATAYFGGLCTFTILFALICELFITPFLLKQFPVFRRSLEGNKHG